jgi:hypothetical protein
MIDNPDEVSMNSLLRELIAPRISIDSFRQKYKMWRLRSKRPSDLDNRDVFERCQASLMRIIRIKCAPITVYSRISLDNPLASLQGFLYTCEHCCAIGLVKWSEM